MTSAATCDCLGRWTDSKQHCVGAGFVGFATADDARDLKEIFGEVLRAH